MLLCGAVAIGGLVFAANLYSPPPALPGPNTSPTLAIPRGVNSATPPISGENPTVEAEPTQPNNLEGPQGKIVYVCQMFKNQNQDQICIINADGSGERRLTTADHSRHFYPSFAPDGKSVLYSSDMNSNFKIFEQNVLDGSLSLGEVVGIAPEVSPNNRYIAYTRGNGKVDTIWISDRDGSNQRQIYIDAWDPTWSPDSKSLLFATNVANKPQLAIINLDGTDFHVITTLPDLRGRSDWSEDGLHIVTYSGKPWERELFLMNADGSDMHQVSPAGGNSQGPSFSPDGQWIAFTAYFDQYRINNGCEIYIMRIDGSTLTRLTKNDYCDWQPRWGP
jgi:Tol biopolymer transport system component